MQQLLPTPPEVEVRPTVEQIAAFAASARPAPDTQALLRRVAFGPQLPRL